MIEYKVTESKENPLDSVIVKTGGEVTFTLANVENDIAYLNKAKKEIVAQSAIQEATKANVTRTHPHVAQMTQEDLTAAHIYRDATGYLTIAKEKLDEIEKHLTNYETEKIEILKQTGLQIEAPKPLLLEAPAEEVKTEEVKTDSETNG